MPTSGLNPRVGSDAALAMGMAQVIVQEKLYRPAYVVEQTDLPFLVREDTRRFLREKDLKAGGREEVFYLWDRKRNRPAPAPRKSLRLGTLEPALEGISEVRLADGKMVQGRTVFELLKDKLEEYSPEKASQITGFHPETIRKLARDYARARAALILSSMGIPHDLSHLSRDFTEGGRLEKPEAVHRHVLAHSSFTQGFSLEQFRSKGFEKFVSAGNTMGYLPGIARDKSNPPFVPCQRFVLRKEPWPTLTVRQQFYIDHDWYFEFGEELPTHKEPPKAGGNFPLRITGGHTRWSIHAIWRDDPYMLRLQRGVPVLYMNPQDAQQRGIADHDRVRVYNDLNSFFIHAKLSPTVQAGQTIVYHAWEPLQYEGHRNHQVVMPSPLKPLHLVGNYGHLRYQFFDQQPNQIDRDTVVEVEKA